MAAGGWTRKMKELRMTSGSSFTLAVAVLLIAAFSYQFSIASAAAVGTVDGSEKSSSMLLISSQTTTTTRIGEEADSMISMDKWWEPFTDALVKVLKFVKNKIMDEYLRFFGFPPSHKILHYLITVVRFLCEKLMFWIKNHKQVVNTALDWVVDSAFTPFKSIKKGIKSFGVLFKFLHKLRKGSVAGFFLDNPIYRCYLHNHPPCVALAKGNVQRVIIYHFYCAWSFYEICHIQFWFEKGKWKSPDVNFNTPCRYMKKKKCSDQPPASS